MRTAGSADAARAEGGQGRYRRDTSGIGRRNNCTKRRLCFRLPACCSQQLGSAFFAHLPDPRRAGLAFAPCLSLANQVLPPPPGMPFDTQGLPSSCMPAPQQPSLATTPPSRRQEAGAPPVWRCKDPRWYRPAPPPKVCTLVYTRVHAPSRAFAAALCSPKRMHGMPAGWRAKARRTASAGEPGFSTVREDWGAEPRLECVRQRARGPTWLSSSPAHACVHAPPSGSHRRPPLAVIAACACMCACDPTWQSSPPAHASVHASLPGGHQRLTQ
eukprot:356656-Chlamydomonas_euryale.AAC.6